jgi:hypothetical protein
MAQIEQKKLQNKSMSKQEHDLNKDLLREISKNKQQLQIEVQKKGLDIPKGLLDKGDKS